MSIYPWTNDPELNRVQVEEAKAVDFENRNQAVKRVDPGAAGCWINGDIGHYLSAEIILIAADYGWKDERAIDAAYRYWGNDPNSGGPDLAEYVYDAALEAEEWMNEHVAPEGYMFGCEDGEFFLMHQDWWGEPLDLHWIAD